MKSSPPSSASLPTPPSESDSLVCLANAILSQCHVERVIHSFAEIDVDLFVTAFEALAGERLNDVFRPATTDEESVHNAQVVIDSLSMDILHTSLSHVEGSAIASGDPVAVKNLLEIFAGLLEFILGKISEGDAEGSGEDSNDAGPKALSGGDDEAANGHHATTDDDADIPSFLRAEAAAPPTALSERRRSVGSVLPIPVAQSSLQSSKQSSEVESVHSQGTSTAAIVKESEMIAARLGLRPTDDDLEATRDIGREGIEKAMKAQEEMRRMLARWTHEDGGTAGNGEREKECKTGEILSADDEETPEKTEENFSVELLVQSGEDAGSEGKGDGSREGTKGDGEPTKTPSEAPDDVPASALVTSDAVASNLDDGVAGAEVEETVAKKAASADTEEDEEAENHLKRLRTLLQSYETLQTMIKDALNEQRSTDDGGGEEEEKTNFEGRKSDASKNEEEEEEIVTIHRGRRGAKDSLPKTFASRVNEKLDAGKVNADAAAGKSSGENETSTGAPFCAAGAAVASAAEKPTEDRVKKSTTRESASGASVARSRASERQKRKEKQPRRPAASESERKKPPPRPIFASVERSKTPTRRECRLVLDEIPVGEKMTPRVVVGADRKSPRRPGRSAVSPRRSGFASPGRRSGVSPRRSGVIYPHDVSRQRRVSSSASPKRKDGVEGKKAGEAREEKRGQDPQRRKKQITFAEAESPPRKKQQGKGGMSAAQVVDAQMARAKENVANELWKEGNKRRIQKLVLKNILEKKMKENEGKVEGKRREIRDEGRKGTRKYLREIREQKLEEEEENERIESGERLVASALTDNKCCHDEERLETAEDDDDFTREDAFLKALLKEFPHLHLSRDVLHRMWLDAATKMDKIKRIHASSAAARVGSDKAGKELEETRRKYALASTIRRKEAAAEAQRVAAIEEKKRLRQMKSRHEEKRHLKARTKRYYDDLVVGQRAKMLKAKTDEELVFKRLFSESVKAQQQQLREYRKLAAEVKEKRLQSQRDQLDSMENYYRDQFSMLSEALNREQYEEGVRRKEQSLVLAKMQRHLRRKMEGDIRTMQEQMRHSDEDTSSHFREVEAQLLSKQLHVPW